MDPIDKLLAELKAELQSENQSDQSKPTPTRPAVQPKFKSDSFIDDIDDLLAEIKADFQKQELRKELKRLQELEEKQGFSLENCHSEQLQILRKMPNIG
jgi:hypothetical protein